MERIGGYRFRSGVRCGSVSFRIWRFPVSRVQYRTGDSNDGGARCSARYQLAEGGVGRLWNRETGLFSDTLSHETGRCRQLVHRDRSGSALQHQSLFGRTLPLQSIGCLRRHTGIYLSFDPAGQRAGRRILSVRGDGRFGDCLRTENRRRTPTLGRIFAQKAVLYGGCFRVRSSGFFDESAVCRGEGGVDDRAGKCDLLFTRIGEKPGLCRRR